MTTPALDVTAFANSLHALLATPPPSLSAPTSANALPVLSQLLQPEFLNGSDEMHSVWRALQQLPPPSFEGAATAARSSTGEAGSAGAPTSLYLVLASSLDALDDGSCCISCPLDPTSAEQLELAPHSISLVEVPLADDAAAQEVNTKRWQLPWSNGKKLQRQKQVLERKTFYPPKDKLSLLVAWWGYQVFLPEAVMKQIGSELEPYVDGLSALSAALAFIASQAPKLLLLVPGGALLSSIGLPIIAALSSACTFSWKYLKSKDKGEGIILAATWLIPVAVVPRTLEGKEWMRQERRSRRRGS
ncbi:hypothetical protein BCR35DRAFT_334514 [Leucosporidium creatinivorum]|uniref:Uncharacterized protein n=1 Tax=Leucosporidium creatinivorum TaxID=106004 RepID=A0A1Y2E5X8_9BASI|nr:hypothetical protein BCR35DRAFT_334514 [Leucosporidium creatinivorum]